MHKRKIFICILALLLVGCAKIKDITKLDEFYNVARAYEQALRWSDFTSASTFLERSESPSPDPEILKIVRVTDYGLKKTVASDDETQVLQIVEISYYLTNRMVVKTVTDRQQWEWDTDAQQWRLKSGWPDFK